MEELRDSQCISCWQGVPEVGCMRLQGQLKPLQYICVVNRLGSLN